MFFGLGYPIGLYLILDRRPQIIINEIGIYERNVIKKTVNWEIINDAYLVKISRQLFLCLVIDDEYKPLTTGKFHQVMDDLNESMGLQKLSIPMINVAADPEKLVTLIHNLKGYNAGERAQQWSIETNAISN